MTTPRVIKLALAVLAALTLIVAPSPAASAPTWAPAATAAIHPGVQTYTAGAQCTANFVFFDATDVFIGQAAHCSGTGAQTDTNGCETGSLPLGTPVEVDGATRPGTLVYNSWLAMQAAGETDPAACAYNDFALVRLDPADHGRVNPSVPHWGGPIAVDTNGVAVGERVYSYGNSSLRFGIQLLSPKVGTNDAELGGGWSHATTMITPGIPGDSGSGLLDSAGRAAGVLSTLGVSVPGGFSNNWTDAGKALAYAQANGFAGVQMAAGTEAFNPNRLPIGI
jgi:hypothetical protein